MASKLDSLDIEELYAKEKKTAAVIAAIVKKSDFSEINDKYCEEICRLKCKSTKGVRLEHNPVDILIIQDTRNPMTKFDRKPDQQDVVQGAIIQFIAKEAGFNSAGVSYRLVSLLKCAADKADFPNGKPPMQTTLDRCFPYLHEELIRSKPKVIISLGTASTKALGLTKHSNTGNRGEVAFSEYGPVVITLHPKVLTYIRQNARGGGGMWGPDYLKVVQRDFEKAVKLATGAITWTPNTLSETVKELAKSRIKVAKSLDDVKEYCSEIKALPLGQVVSWDTETTGLDPFDPATRILTTQFGWTDKSGVSVARVIPLYHRENKAYDPDLAWAEVEEILVNESITKCGHNSKFDILMVAGVKKVRVQGVKFDTLLVQHSIESGTQSCYGLKTMCWDHLLELGFAGYENALGSLAQLKKDREKLSLKENEDEEELAIEEE
jgi:uracil-DNA glycosylase